MHGFICDRCRALDPGQQGDQRDPGPFPPSKWTKIAIQGSEWVHLCEGCSADFRVWVHDATTATPRGVVAATARWTCTGLAPPTPEAPRDRILWNRRPKNVSDTGDIDEIVAHNVTVHIEQMDDRCWWIGITWPDGSYWDGNFYATKKGKMTFGQQDYREGGWPTDEEHEQ